MKSIQLGLVIYSNDLETVWNAFRLGIYSLKQQDRVKVFLLAKGVELESLNSEQFNLTDLAREFIELGGEILACGSCLQIRYSEGSEVCPISTMQDLYEMIRESDQVLTF